MKSFSLLPSAMPIADRLSITVLQRLKTGRSSRYFGLHLDSELVRNDFKRWAESNRGEALLEGKDSLAAYHQAEDGYGRYYPLNLLQEALLEQPAAARSPVKPVKLMRARTVGRKAPPPPLFGHFRKAS